MERVQKLIKDFQKIHTIIHDNLPDGMQYCLAVHIRDTKYKDKDFPDGYGEHILAFHGTDYEKAYFKDLVAHNMPLHPEDIDDE